MEFVIEQASSHSGRLGQMKLATGKILNTPLLLQTTKGGSIPYLSRAVFDYITKDLPALQVSLSTIEHMVDAYAQFPGSGMGAYFGFAGAPLLISVRDPNTQMPQGHNDKDTVSLFTRHGKVPVTAEKYMDMIAVIAPDIYQGLSDADTHAESSKKRMSKSVARTKQFMDYCYERQRTCSKLRQCALLAPIVGGYCTYARSESIRHAQTAAGCGHGYILEGFHSYGISAWEVRADKLLPVMKHCLAEMDASKPRYMPGAYLPLMTLQLVQMGVDMFDTSLAYCAAMQFQALVYDYDPENRSKQIQPGYYLDMKHTGYKEDFRPFREGCNCLACRQHTRAYVHHLYQTKELLGPILLMIHNLHHTMQFFAQIRRCIGADSLPALLDLLLASSSGAVPPPSTDHVAMDVASSGSSFST